MMANNGKGAQPTGSKTLWMLIAGAAALALVLLGALLLLRPADEAPAPAAGGGAPRLAVDQEKIDFGDVKYNTPVKATFRLTNEGDGTLQIIGEPVVAVVEGC
jgi:hypothetical protein